MENEPVMNLTVGGKEFEATRDNTSLFTFLGRTGVNLAMYNHIFLVTDEEKSMGTYVFNTHSSFQNMAQYMLENNYPAHLNIRDVPECDMNAFSQMVAREVERDLEGGVPEDWTK